MTGSEFDPLCGDGSNLKAAYAALEPKCDHICLKDDGHVCGAGHHHRSVRAAVACDESDDDFADTVVGGVVVGPAPEESDAAVVDVVVGRGVHVEDGGQLAPLVKEPDLHACNSNPPENGETLQRYDGRADA